MDLVEKGTRVPQSHGSRTKRLLLSIRRDCDRFVFEIGIRIDVMIGRRVIAGTQLKYYVVLASTDFRPSNEGVIPYFTGFSSISLPMLLS